MPAIQNQRNPRYGLNEPQQPDLQRVFGQIIDLKPEQDGERRLAELLERIARAVCQKLSPAL